MLKRTLLPALLFIALFSLNAQEKGSFKIGIDIGILPDSGSESLGLLLNIEPKLNVSDYATIGLRVGLTANSLTYENRDVRQFVINEISGNGSISFVPTFDYQWLKLRFRSSLGIGVGPYLLVSFLDVLDVRATNPAEEIIEVNVGPQIGMLLRDGFDLSRLRIGLEYNFVPKADVELPDGQIAGTVDRTYFGVSLGFTIRT